VTIFNALVAALLWGGLRTGHNFFQFVFGKTFRYTPTGWYKMTRNAGWFFLITAIVNEAVRLGCANMHVLALNRVLTGVDIWILFKLFVVMPLTALFFWWQVRQLQQYRLPDAE
jgi:intracellular septation protein